MPDSGCDTRPQERPYHSGDFHHFHICRRMGIREICRNGKQMVVTIYHGIRAGAENKRIHPYHGGCIRSARSCRKTARGHNKTGNARMDQPSSRHGLLYDEMSADSRTHHAGIQFIE